MRLCWILFCVLLILPVFFLKGSKHNFVDKIAIWCSQGVLLQIINLAEPGGRESEFSKSWLWSWPVKLFTASWMKNGQSSDGKALLAFLHTISLTMRWIPFWWSITLSQRAFNPEKISWWLQGSTEVFPSFSYNFLHNFSYMKICRLLFIK